MAEVYVARTRGHGGFERLVAIKVIHPRFSEDPSFADMLIEEAKLAVILNHANVVQTFDLASVDGTYCIVMEFIDGADAYTLQKRTNIKRAHLPIDICAYIVSEACTGLHYAHRKTDSTGNPLDLVHRDISPQNVLISRSGEVKIVDFGIAKAKNHGGHTEVGVIKGKYYYMSPEQAWADPLDHRSDVFSAGIVLHELLTGEMVYQEDNLPKLLTAVREAEIEPPSKKRPEIPQELDEIVMRAVASQTNDRFPDAQAFSAALRRFLHRHHPRFSKARVVALMRELFPREDEAPLPSEERVLSQKPLEPAPTESVEVMRQEDFRPAVRSVIFDAASSHPASNHPEYFDESDGEEPTKVQRPLADLYDASEWDDATVVDATGDLVKQMRSKLESEIAQKNQRRITSERPAGALLPDSTRHAVPRSKIAESDTKPRKRPGRQLAPPQNSVQTRPTAKPLQTSPSGAPLDTAPSGKPLQTSPTAKPLREETTASAKRNRRALMKPPAARTFSKPTPDSTASGSLASGDIESIDSDIFADDTTTAAGAPVQDPTIRTAPADPTEKRPPLSDADLGLRPPRNVPGLPPTPGQHPGFGAPSQTATGPRNETGPMRSASVGIPDLSTGTWEEARDPRGRVAPPPIPAGFDALDAAPSAFDTARLKAQEAAQLSQKRRPLLIAAAVLGLIIIAGGLGFFARKLSAPEVESRMDVTSVPAGAVVILDGRELPGRTPMTGIGPLQLGRSYSLEVRHEGYAPWSKDVTASEGTFLEVATLDALRKTLVIQSEPPGAIIYVDGARAGNAPITLQDLSLGRVLRLRAVSGEASTELQLTVEESMPAEIRLQPQ